MLACPWPATCHPHPQDPFPHLSPSSFQHDKFMHRTDSSLGVKTLNLPSNPDNSSVSKRQTPLFSGIPNLPLDLRMNIKNMDLERTKEMCQQLIQSHIAVFHSFITKTGVDKNTYLDVSRSTSSCKAPRFPQTCSTAVLMSKSLATP